MRVNEQKNEGEIEEEELKPNEEMIEYSKKNYYATLVLIFIFGLTLWFTWQGYNLDKEVYNHQFLPNLVPTEYNCPTEISSTSPQHITISNPGSSTRQYSIIVDSKGFDLSTFLVSDEKKPTLQLSHVILLNEYGKESFYVLTQEPKVAVDSFSIQTTDVSKNVIIQDIECEYSLSGDEKNKKYILYKK